MNESIHTIEALPAWEDVYSGYCWLCVSENKERIDCLQRCESCYSKCSYCDEQRAMLLIDGARSCRSCAKEIIQLEIDDAESTELIAALLLELAEVSA